MRGWVVSGSLLMERGVFESELCLLLILILLRLVVVTVVVG